MSNLLNAQPTYTRGVQSTSELAGLAVTPSDSVDLPDGGTEALRVTGAGNVNVNLASGGTAVLTGLAAGQMVRINVSRVLATSTTATGIQALYAQGGR